MNINRTSVLPSLCWLVSICPPSSPPFPFLPGLLARSFLQLPIFGVVGRRSMDGWTGHALQYTVRLLPCLLPAQLLTRAACNAIMCTRRRYGFSMSCRDGGMDSDPYFVFGCAKGDTDFNIPFIRGDTGPFMHSAQTLL